MRKTVYLAASAFALSVATTAHAADPDLTVFDWAGFEVQALIEPYVAKHGIMPTYALYADEDEAFSKLTSGFKADVGHPCSGMVGKYRDANLIEPWDVSRIAEFANIAPRFLNSPDFKDDAGVWFIPTDYAYTAIAYNTDAVTPEQASSLNVFIDPAFAGSTSLPESMEDSWALAFLATGVSDWTNVSDAQFAAAAAWLRQAHANVRTYWSDPTSNAQLMKTGEAVVSWSWNDGVVAMKNEGIPIAFNRTPTEGVTNWFYGLVNFKDAPGSEDKAYDFVNAWLDHGSAKGLLENFGYAHANDAAMAKITIEDLKAADVDPVDGIMLSQVPLNAVLREKMIAEFELIKSGF